MRRGEELVLRLLGGGVGLDRPHCPCDRLCNRVQDTLAGLGRPVRCIARVVRRVVGVPSDAGLDACRA